MNPGAANKQCELSDPIDIDKCACRAKYPVNLHALGYWSMVWRDCRPVTPVMNTRFACVSVSFECMPRKRITQA